jgi:hypothetical protein
MREALLQLFKSLNITYHGWSSWNHSYENSCPTLCWIFGMEVVYPEGLQCGEWGTFPWVVQVVQKRFYWLELLWESTNCESGCRWDS